MRAISQYAASVARILGMSKATGLPVLLCHGDADPFTPPAALEACVAQLRAARAPWQLHTYGGAPHAFTNPAQAFNGKAGFGYDRAAAESSWHAAKGFLADLACGGIE